MRHFRAALAAILLSITTPAIAGDAEIIQLSPGVYMAIVKNYAGAFGQMSTTKKKAILAANEYASKQGMDAVPVNMETREARPGQWPAVEYQFRLVPRGGNDAVSIDRAADTRIEISGATPSSSQPAAQPDLYTELTKLDDLRKRGIITDAEFDAQKAKLLSR